MGYKKICRFACAYRSRSFQHPHHESRWYTILSSVEAISQEANNIVVFGKAEYPVRMRAGCLHGTHMASDGADEVDEVMFYGKFIKV
ncbi:hypothetical protein [Gorillibacterium massiliense]|uniref:hypothetical protein n=1 Tax=Gorillibacterium massiliense TaxID=1280390 RepID=UPI0005946FE9|nr:hypothetical protein [Gorillibacterium massiliense]